MEIKKEIRNRILLGLGIMTVGISQLIAQDVKEVIQPLSKKAVKGYLYSAEKEESGGIKVTYIMKGEKKGEQDNYEEYSFSNTLAFSGSKDIQVQREPHADREQVFYYASVGGSNSFNVLSMDLKLTKVVRRQAWDYSKQRYVTAKVITNETVKPRNDNGVIYKGYASYNSEKEGKNGVFVLAKAEAKKKGEDDKFYTMQFDDRLELSPVPLDLKGSYTLVFCDQLFNENVVMIFAPDKGNGSPDNYLFFQYDISGNLINRTEFKSPFSAMLITAAIGKDNNVYFSGSSLKSKGAWAEVFSEYAPIYNPGYTEGANNKVDFGWQKAANEKMENFHLLKFAGKDLVFVSTTPMAEFKSKFKTSPGDKGADSYKGKKFHVEQFYVTPEEDYVIAGQLKDKVNLGAGNPVDSYHDIVCFHFDRTGKLKAQYGVEKMNTDKKSEIFEMQQNFYPAADGKSLYWVIFEVKGIKGYDGFLDAYNEKATFYPVFFPRIAKIDLAGASVGSFKVLGDEKFFLRKYNSSIFDAKENSMIYLGHDDDFKKLWLGKVSFNK